MNDLPGDGAEPTPSEVVETEPFTMHNPPPNERPPWTRFEVTPLPPALGTASIIDVVPLSSQHSTRPAKRSLWSTRVSLLLVAALVGGFGRSLRLNIELGTRGVTIDAVTNKPGRGLSPGWNEYSETDQ